MSQEIERLKDLVFDFLMNNTDAVQQVSRNEFLVAINGKTCSVKFGKC